MITMLMSAILSTAMFTLIMSTPISMGLTILTMAMATSLLFATMNSSWMAFLIFLIYISGTLIMFAYFVAMAPNKTMFFPIQIPLIMSTPPIMVFLCYNLSPSLNSHTSLMQINTFYSKLSIPLLMIMALILLITMIIVVKISSSTKGPLRSFHSYV